MKKNYRVLSLYSGSDGNATLISTPSTSILIDAGKSAKALKEALLSVGSSIDNIDAIFITHEHTDHVSALEIISKKHEIPIHMMEGSASRFDRTPLSPIHKNLVRHSTVFCEKVGDLTVSAFRTPHDSVMSVGFRIEIGESEAFLGFATDIGYVSDAVKEGLIGCEAVVLESNHDLDMLMTGPYPRELKNRINSNRGHLSNTASASFAIDLARSGTKSFLLAHLSAENNRPDIALDEFSSALSDMPVTVSVASQFFAVELPPIKTEVLDA